LLADTSDQSAEIQHCAKHAVKNPCPSAPGPQTVSRAISPAGFAGRSLVLHTIARHNQQCPEKLGHIGFVAQSGMPRNDLVLLSTKVRILSAAKSSVDFSAGLASMTGRSR